MGWGTRMPDDVETEKGWPSTAAAVNQKGFWGNETKFDKLGNAGMVVNVIQRSAMLRINAEIITETFWLIRYVRCAE